MLKLELGELYGMDNIEQLMLRIRGLRQFGMTDEEIQEVLDRSKTGSITTEGTYTGDIESIDIKEV